MPMNSFASQKEVIFVMYDDIIKTTKFNILKKDIIYIDDANMEEDHD